MKRFEMYIVAVFYHVADLNMLMEKGELTYYSELSQALKYCNRILYPIILGNEEKAPLSVITPEKTVQIWVCTCPELNLASIENIRKNANYIFPETI